MDLLKQYSQELDVQIYHYCLMANHTHILLKTENVKILSKFAHYIQRKFAYYYCKTYHWPEQVFRKRFVSLPINKDSYLLECGRYIERNSLRAGLVKDLRSYPYSSYPHYAEGVPNSLVTQNPLYLDLGRSVDERVAKYKDYLSEDRPYEQMVDKAFFKANVSPRDGVR